MSTFIQLHEQARRRRRWLLIFAAVCVALCLLEHLPMLCAGERVLMSEAAMGYHLVFIPAWLLLIAGGSGLIALFYGEVSRGRLWLLALGFFAVFVGAFIVACLLYGHVAG
jgi:hypothetical protein